MDNKKIKDLTIKNLQNKEGIGYTMQDFKTHPGYIVIENILKEEVGLLTKKIRSSNSAEEVFSCTKRKYGILFVIEEVERLILEGNEAMEALRRTEPI